MNDKKYIEQKNIIDKAFQASTRNKATALKTLQKAGIISKSGKLTKSFGG